MTATVESLTQAHRIFQSIVERRMVDNDLSVGHTIKINLSEHVEFIFSEKLGKRVLKEDAWLGYFLYMKNFLPSIFASYFEEYNSKYSFQENVLDKWTPKRNGLIPQAFAGYMFCHIGEYANEVIARQLDIKIIGRPFHDIFGARVPVSNEEAIALEQAEARHDYNMIIADQLPSVQVEESISTESSSMRDSQFHKYSANPSDIAEGPGRSIANFLFDKYNLSDLTLSQNDMAMHIENLCANGRPNTFIADSLKTEKELHYRDRIDAMLILVALDRPGHFPGKAFYTLLLGLLQSSWRNSTGFRFELGKFMTPIFEYIEEKHRVGPVLQLARQHVYNETSKEYRVAFMGLGRFGKGDDAIAARVHDNARKALLKGANTRESSRYWWQDADYAILNQTIELYCMEWFLGIASHAESEAFLDDIRSAHFSDPEKSKLVTSAELAYFASRNMVDELGVASEEGLKSLDKETELGRALEAPLRLNLISLSEGPLSERDLSYVQKYANRSEKDFWNFIFSNCQFLIPHALELLRKQHALSLDPIRKHSSLKMEAPWPLPEFDL